MNEDPVDWLLEAENPSVRYFTLRELLDRPEEDSEVVEARSGIMGSTPIEKILAKQEPGGYWGKPEDFYMRGAKYKGTVWNLLILAQLGADGKDERIKRACEFVLDNVYDRNSGGFVYRRSKENEGDDRDAIIPCLTGNMAWSLVRFGYYDNGRVQRSIGWLSQYMRFDDGATEAPGRWPYVKHDNCWGSHTCFMAVVKSLKVLAEIPKIHSKGIDYTIDASVEFLLNHHIYRHSHDLSKVAMPGWLQFGFPYMYNTDLLEILGIMAKLGVNDDRLQDAVDVVVSKQDGHGRWNLDFTFNGRMLANIDIKGQPSKWVTLNALRVMKAYSK